MSHFYGSVQGGRGIATRTGHKSSGLTARAAGWGIGATVNALHYDGKDTLSLNIDSGNGAGRQHHAQVVTFFDEDGVLQVNVLSDRANVNVNGTQVR